MTNRNLLIILAAVLVALTAAVIAVALTIGSASGPEQAAPVIPEAEAESAEETEARIPQQLEMVVFFQSTRRADLLVPTRRSVFNTISIGQQADQLLQKLIQGPAPAEGLLPTVPQGTQLQRLYIAEDGTAFVAFNAALAQLHGGGAAGEMMTIYSIVNTLCVNFPSIRRVQILVVLFAFILSLFASRLVELQVFKSDELAESAVNQRRVSEKIPATRGTIIDVNGCPLAVSVEV